MNKIIPTPGVFKTPTTIRKDAEKKLRADIAANDRRILGVGIRGISPGKACEVWDEAFPDQHLDYAAAPRLAHHLELCATATCNAAMKLPREEERQFVKMERLLVETRGMFPEDDKGEEGSKQPPGLFVEGGLITAAAARDWIAELELVVARTKRRHSVACKFQEESGGGPHRVFALHLYHAATRFGWVPRLSRDAETGKLNGPFVKFACEAWALCFPDASQMPPRTVETVMRGRGAFQLQRLPENSHPAQFTDGGG